MNYPYKLQFRFERTGELLSWLHEQLGEQGQGWWRTDLFEVGFEDRSIRDYCAKRFDATNVIDPAQG